MIEFWNKITTGELNFHKLIINHCLDVWSDLIQFYLVRFLGIIRAGFCIECRWSEAKDFANNIGNILKDLDTQGNGGIWRNKIVS